MGSRTKYRKCDAYPASNSYQLPPLIGPKITSKTASNAYSMTSRRKIGSFDQDLARTPGAARQDYYYRLYFVLIIYTDIDYNNILGTKS